MTQEELKKLLPVVQVRSGGLANWLDWSWNLPSSFNDIRIKPEPIVKYALVDSGNTTRGIFGDMHDAKESLNSLRAHGELGLRIAVLTETGEL